MSDAVLPCATCGAETSAALAGEIAYVEPPAGPTRWLCPTCSARLPVALDYITESRGGGDPHAEYVERLESALMAGWFELLMNLCAWQKITTRADALFQWFRAEYLQPAEGDELGEGLRIIRAPVPPGATFTSDGPMGRQLSAPVDLAPDEDDE